MRHSVPIVIVALVLLCAGPALAQDVLQLRSGRLVAGEVVTFDENGVTFRTEAGDAKYAWSSVKPISQYEIRADRLPEEDAEGHVALARFCFESRLYPYARREIATARGLEYPDGKLLDELSLAVDQAEADEAFARIEQLVAEEDYDQALDEVSRFVRQAPRSEHTDRAHALAAEILKKRDARMLEEQEEKKEAEKTAKEEAQQKRIQRYLDRATEEKKAAATSFAEGIKNHELTKVKRAKDAYLKAERAWLTAVAALNRVQRLSRRGVTFEKAEADKDLIRKKLVRVYLALTNLFVEQKNWKGATPYVNKALYLDPVNEEALALRKKIDDERLTRSARKITNTPAVRTR